MTKRKKICTQVGGILVCNLGMMYLEDYGLAMQDSGPWGLPSTWQCTRLASENPPTREHRGFF